MPETRYIHLRLPIVVVDNLLCDVSCTQFRSTLNPDRGALCILEPEKSLRADSDGNYFRSTACEWAELRACEFEIDPKRSVIVVEG